MQKDVVISRLLHVALIFEMQRNPTWEEKHIVFESIRNTYEYLFFKCLFKYISGKALHCYSKFKTSVRISI